MNADGRHHADQVHDHVHDSHGDGAGHGPSGGHDHGGRAVERHCDVAVVGASPAGLAVALQLARRRRSVIVVDDGEPHDGAGAPVPVPGTGGARQPSGPIASRAEVRRHGGEVLVGRVTGRDRSDDGRFRLELAGGHAIVARRLVMAIDVAGDASEVGGTIDADLVDDDLRTEHPSGNQADWDHRYGGERMWSGNPNGTLVEEAAGLAPGRALDVGAGEGGDAVWLAEQGWRVTASDISSRALHRVAAEAARRGLDVECLRADANATDPFGGATFDLVSAQYASIPRTPDDRAVHNLLDAVAPGGTLLVVSHDLAPMRAPADPATGSRPFDPDAYVRVEDVAAALARRPGWEVEVHQTRPRPPGAASSQHVEDVVLRARRHP